MGHALYVRKVPMVIDARHPVLSDSTGQVVGGNVTVIPAQQTCNAEEGCVVNVITNRSTTDVSTDLTNTNTEQTTGQDLLVTTQLNLEEMTILLQYVTLTSLASLMLIAVLCSYCLLVNQCYKKKRMRNDLKNGEDVPAPAAGLELIPQSAIVDNTVYGSDYTEISDSQTAYGDSRVLSSVYDEPSF